uniref:Uncharacterized protein n=1 Tax=Rhodosorus marinus TaxID=101924 RepID=A0A7S0BP40_9RHOD|mmetsp:Transcript_3158/g.4523  ORF Transcript_3158/g.4523 Transcript_3158/m.4523 type:complete len:241 (+) Transcript_3158:44-766(+)
MMFEVGFIPAPGFGLTAGLRSSAKRWKVGNFSQRGVRVRRAAYGEEFNEFETKGNTKLQDKLVQEINFDIHKIVLADHIDFYVSSEILKLRENLREQFKESRKRIHERGDQVARLESANATYKWDKLVRDAEIQNKTAAKEARREVEALESMINRKRNIASSGIKSKAYVQDIQHDHRLAVYSVCGSLIASYLIANTIIRALQLTIHDTGLVSVAQVGFLFLTMLLVLTSSLSMALPPKQ